MSTPVLFDTQGPRARRNTWIASGFAMLLLALLLYVLGRQLDENNQFDAEKWTPFVDPGNEYFAQVWEILGRAFLRNLQAAAIAMALSLVIGIALALTRITANRAVRPVVVGFIELFRGIPVVISIFFAFRVLPEFGVDLSAMWYLVIGLTVYNSVVIAEIVRAGIAAVPRGQLEAAEAIGLSRGQALRIVMLPQGVRIMLPALISQLVVVLKDTSLGFIVSYEELVRTANRVGTQLDNPIQSLLVAALIFIVVNMLLGLLATWVERRLSRSTAGRADAVLAPDAAAGLAPARVGA